jgi:hypothetical protein
MATTTTTTASTGRPCRCWVEPWSHHDGHCCFHPDSPGDCHDTEGATLSSIHRPAHSGRNGLGGPADARLYWLTRKGWVAALLAQQPALGQPLRRPTGRSS